MKIVGQPQYFGLGLHFIDFLPNFKMTHTV